MRQLKKIPLLHRAGAALLVVTSLLWAKPSHALETVQISAFQGSFVALPLYVAEAYHLFRKHGIKAELIYGTGIQVTNILVGGSAQFGAFAVEHGVTLLGKNQKLKLLVVCQGPPPYGLIVRNNVPTPNINKPYPERLVDLRGLKLGISTVGAATDITLHYLLQRAGIKPSEVKIIPVGGPGPQVAGIKNGVIDGALSFEPAQSEAVYALKIAKMVLDIEGGEGPKFFRNYAYNGVWATDAYLKTHQKEARAIAAAVVDAEKMINNPADTDKIVKVAVAHMHGIDPKLLRAFIVKHRDIYRPVATPAQIANVELYLTRAKLLHEKIPYEGVVATGIMPKSFTAASAK